jgi:glycosyl transferase family 87
MRTGAVALCLLAVGWGMCLTLDPWADERVTDVPLYRAYALDMGRGELPFRDFGFEYPPLAAPVMGLPALIASGYDGYRLAFAAAMLVLAAGMVLLAGRLAARMGGDPGRAMLAAAAAPLLTGAMIRTHFDLAPVVLTLAALLLLCTDRPRAGLAVLGLGAATKLFPLVIVPVALAWLVARGQRRAALEGALALIAVLVVGSGIAAALSAEGSYDALRYHAERPLQVESTPALAAQALDAAGIGSARSVHSHGSHGVTHPADGALEALSAALVALAAAALAVAAARRPGRRELVLASLGAVVAFAALGKVLSPQFLIWVVPLAALALAWRLHALAAAAALAIGLTLVEFPARYFDVVDREPLPVAVVALRNCCLLLVLGLAMRALVSMPAPAVTARRATAAARST